MQTEAAGQPRRDVAQAPAHRRLLQRDDVGTKLGERFGDHLQPALELVTVAREAGPRTAMEHVERHHDQIAVTVDLYAEDWPQLKGVMVQGRAEVFDRGPRFRRIRSGLYRKYPQYEKDAALDESDSVVVRVVPEHVFSWGFEAGK